jgi:hypothetical protein
VLDQVVEANPGIVAHVEWHTVNTYAPYCAEGRSKWFLYPPPYQGGYATPWLWVDGKSRSYQYSSWQNYIYDQMLVPSDVSLNHVGTTYDPASRTGQLQVECYNGGTTSITAALQFAITEDSVHFTGPNGDPWHNGVCRDYVPNQNGTALTLGAGVTDTVPLSFALDSTWVESKVKLVVYLQNMTAQADSSEPVYQGLVGNVLDFVPGVEESRLVAGRDLRVSVSPNPCRTGCEFALSGAAANGARITVYTPDGRLVSSLQTVANRVSWSRAGVARGIYLYRVNAGTATAEGKLIVAD